MIEKPFKKVELLNLWNTELKLDKRVYKTWVSFIFAWTIKPIMMLFCILAILIIWIYVYGTVSIKVLFDKLVKK